MRRILHDLELITLCQGRHALHIPNLPHIMHRQNRHDLSAAGESMFDPPFRIGNVHVEVRFPAIHQ